MRMDSESVQRLNARLKNLGLDQLAEPVTSKFYGVTLTLSASKIEKVGLMLFRFLKILSNQVLGIHLYMKMEQEKSFSEHIG